MSTFSGQEHYQDLSPEVSLDMFYYTNAILLLEKNEFHKALDYLNKVHIDVFAFNIDHKILMIRIFHELKYHENVMNHLDSFRHFIRTNKTITKERRERLKYFIRYMQKLTRCILNEDFEPLGFLQKEVRANEEVDTKEWLMNKIIAYSTK